MDLADERRQVLGRNPFDDDGDKPFVRGADFIKLPIAGFGLDKARAHKSDDRVAACDEVSQLFRPFLTIR